MLFSNNYLFTMLSKNLQRTWCWLHYPLCQHAITLKTLATIVTTLSPYMAHKKSSASSFHFSFYAFETGRRVGGDQPLLGDGNFRSVGIPLKRNSEILIPSRSSEFIAVIRLLLTDRLSPKRYAQNTHVLQ